MVSNQLRFDVIFQAITKHLLKSYYATEKGYKHSFVCISSSNEAHPYGASALYENV